MSHKGIPTQWRPLKNNGLGYEYYLLKLRLRRLRKWGLGKK